MSESKELILSNNDTTFDDVSNDLYKNTIPFGEEKESYEPVEIDVDLLNTYNELYSNMRRISASKRLENVMDAIGDEEPKALEDDYYSKFDCQTEADKIILEAKYVITKLLFGERQYKNNPNYKKYLDETHKILGIVSKLRNSNRLSANDFSDFKQRLLLIELDFRLPVAFVTEVGTVYKLVNETPKKGGATK